MFVAMGEGTSRRIALKAFVKWISIIAATELIPGPTYSSVVVLANVITDKFRGSVGHHDIDAVLVV
jgi:hypothetical protein